MYAGHRLACNKDQLKAKNQNGRCTRLLARINTRVYRKTFHSSQKEARRIGVIYFCLYLGFYREK
jgi:hypothetical protein